MDKKEIAEILEEMAQLLELQGENPFKINAYRHAAHTLLLTEDDLEKLIKEKRLEELEGIGKKMAEKITLLVTKGRLPAYEKLKRSTPRGLVEMLRIPGLGGKRIKAIYEKLKIHTIAALKEACQKGKIAALAGFGSKSEQKILNALTHAESYEKRHLWWQAMQIAQPLLEKLRLLKGVKNAEVAGSLRRGLETVGDLDFLVAASNPKPIMKWFITQPEVENVQGQGETKASVRLKGGMQADLRIVNENEFGYALLYFTGSKEHNVKLRERAQTRGWTLNEYALTSLNSKKKPPPFSQSKKKITEKEIYRALDLEYIPPELRENRGEFTAAEKGKLPELVKAEEIRGTFHNHTTASDGRNTLKEMVEAAQKLQWEYIGISDHSKSSFQANGLSEERLCAQIEEIRKLNKSKKFRPYVFSGIECDILTDGKLDFSNQILKELDYVVVSVHSSMQQDEKTMTKRLIRAIENPYSTFVGHLTGRLLLRREPYALNIPKVIDACIANKKIIELNANPERLDMDWRFWHSACEKGLMCVINTDAHSIGGLDFFRIGVQMARKGWLEKQNVFNTRPLKDVKKYFHR